MFRRSIQAPQPHRTGRRKPRTGKAAVYVVQDDTVNGDAAVQVFYSKAHYIYYTRLSRVPHSNIINRKYKIQKYDKKNLTTRPDYYFNSNNTAEKIYKVQASAAFIGRDGLGHILSSTTAQLNKYS